MVGSVANLITTTIHCAVCNENEARYVDDTGALVCGTCPITAARDSIRISDVPSLLTWAREVLAGGIMGGSAFASLHRIVGNKP